MSKLSKKQYNLKLGEFITFGLAHELWEVVGDSEEFYELMRREGDC